ncbi:MAG TPA: ATP phosphoribosyltransferase regulatory subunit, partial [Chthoniobacterales bacterium]|nr:ATP phosphoribosyltransferase regulatory subunit [Chthoniobacterales bacterium]
YGFVEWDGPILEPTELFQKKSGTEIVTQLFNFTDKGGREVALRPELTPTLARIVARHGRDFKKPLKWFSIAQCFRYEKQQRGRLREHFQLNCDIVGEGSLNADVELIALAIDLLRAVGFGADDFVVRISDREFWIDFLRSRGVAEERWSELLQIIDKSEREPRAKTAAKLGDLAEATFAILDGHGESEKLNRVMEDLRERGLDTFAKVDLSIVRGLAYYTGIVFEMFDRNGKSRAIAGGGRYDNLVHQLSDGAADAPAVGFAMGDVVLADLIQEHDGARARREETIARTRSLDIYAVIAKEERRAHAVRHVQALRDRGFEVDLALAPAKVGKQFQAAEALGARVAILFGDEWPKVKVKTLATRAEVLVAEEELVQHLDRIFARTA